MANEEFEYELKEFKKEHKKITNVAIYAPRQFVEPFVHRTSPAYRASDSDRASF